MREEPITETVLKESECSEILKIGDNEFTILGLNVERSYEDRSVYYSITDSSGNECVRNWMNGEDAITLGMSLIRQGQFALKANMINHQLIHHVNELKKFVKDERVWILKFTVIDEHPCNYGRGYRTYKVTPIWRRGKSPEFQSDFSFEIVRYWSPFEDEFEKELEYWTQNKCGIVFEGYDREQEVELFNTQLSEMNREYELPRKTWSNVGLQ